LRPQTSEIDFASNTALAVPMTTSKKDGDREAELEAAIENIRHKIWKPKQRLPTLRHAIRSFCKS
jgi:hypothetical protein